MIALPRAPTLRLCISHLSRVQYLDSMNMKRISAEPAVHVLPKNAPLFV